MKYELTWNRIKELIQVDGLVANYDQDRQMVRFTSSDNHKIADLNDWLLDYFPHYLDNISYNVNSPAFDVQDRIGYYWLELICIRMGAASSKGDWVDGDGYDPKDSNGVSILDQWRDAMEEDSDEEVA